MQESSSESRVRSLLTHKVRHIGTAHQRPAKHHFESEREPETPVAFELSGSNVLRNPQIAPGWLQVLSDGCDADILFAQIAKQLLDFGGSFAQPNHESGLRHDFGSVL